MAVLESTLCIWRTVHFWINIYSHWKRRIWIVQLIVVFDTCSSFGCLRGCSSHSTLIWSIILCLCLDTRSLSTVKMYCGSFRVSFKANKMTEKWQRHCHWMVKIQKKVSIVYINIFKMTVKGCKHFFGLKFKLFYIFSFQIGPSTYFLSSTSDHVPAVDLTGAFLLF